MRFSLFSMFVGIAVAALLCGLNLRTTETLTDPYYAPMWGVAPHPPPYMMKEMSVTVHFDRGWPVWHTRSTNQFAAHNVYAFLGKGGLPYQQESPQISPRRVAIDLAVGILLVVASMALCEMIMPRRQANVPTNLPH